MDAYVKAPTETLRIEFDFRDFVASVDPEVVTFVFLGEAGLTLADSTTVPGLIEMDVTGGVTGRVYRVGVEASTPSGEATSDTRRVRLREPAKPPVYAPTSSPYVLAGYVVDGYFV